MKVAVVSSGVSGLAATWVSILTSFKGYSANRSTIALERTQ